MSDSVSEQRVNIRDDDRTLVVADGLAGGGVHLQSADETQPTATKAAGEARHQRSSAHYSQVSDHDDTACWQAV